MGRAGDFDYSFGGVEVGRAREREMDGRSSLCTRIPNYFVARSSLVSDLTHLSLLCPHRSDNCLRLLKAESLRRERGGNLADESWSFGRSFGDGKARCRWDFARSGYSSFPLPRRS